MPENPLNSVENPRPYVIRALAHDGGLFSSQDVTVVVST